jgi:hypothetical protein
MTQTSERPAARGVRLTRSRVSAAHAVELVRSALDVAELLADQVVRPALAEADPPDFTRQIDEVARLLRLAGRVLHSEHDRRRIAGLDRRLAILTRAARIRDLVLGEDASGSSPDAQDVNLVGSAIGDAYVLNHALPCATDCGRLPPPDWADAHWLSGVADALILEALDEDDLARLGQLLMAPALLRTSWSPVQWFGWQVLCDAWSRFGFVPGRGLPEEAEGESPAQGVRRVLGAVHHATLVGGLTVATLLSSGFLPPASPPAEPTGPSIWIDRDGTTRHWHRAWHRLPTVERESLGMVPAGMALHRAVRDADVVAIVRSLDSGPAPLLPEPLVLQAAELVDRLAVLVGGDC